MLLIGISGKKASGKDSLAKYLSDHAKELLHRSFEPRVETLPFAKGLKDFCESLGCPRENLYGTNEQKELFSHVKWGQLPHWHRLVQKYESSLKDMPGLAAHVDHWASRRSQELMTYRELMQQVGTELFADLDPLFWVKQFQMAVRQSRADLLLNTDTRFPKEVRAIRELGGINIRLSRVVHPNDNHASETSLDKDVFNWGEFDLVVPDTLNAAQTGVFVLDWFRNSTLGYDKV